MEPKKISIKRNLHYYKWMASDSRIGRCPHSNPSKRKEVPRIVLATTKDKETQTEPPTTKSTQTPELRSREMWLAYKQANRELRTKIKDLRAKLQEITGTDEVEVEEEVEADTDKEFQTSVNLTRKKELWQETPVVVLHRLPRHMVPESDPPTPMPSSRESTPFGSRQSSPTPPPHSPSPPHPNVRKNKTASARESTLDNVKCDVCQKLFPSKRRMQQHKLKVHKTWKCPRCGKVTIMNNKGLHEKTCFSSPNDP